jgi:hypothetical protein
MSVEGGPDIVTNGLVLYLDAANNRSIVSGSTTWFDLSRNGNTGSLINGPTYSSANGGGIVLDATDDWISIVPNSSLKVDGGDFTIFSVHRIGTVMDNYGNFFYQGSDDNFQGGGIANKSIFFQRYQNDSVELDFYGNGVRVNFGTNSFAANTLVFIAVSFKKTALTSVFFRNGVFSSTQTHTGSPSFTTLSAVQIGKRYINGYFFSTKDLAGTNYITMLYNRSLTNSEILKNYNATKGRYGL